MHLFVTSRSSAPCSFHKEATKYRPKLPQTAWIQHWLSYFDTDSHHNFLLEKSKSAPHGIPPPRHCYSHNLNHFHQPRPAAALSIEKERNQSTHFKQNTNKEHVKGMLATIRPGGFTENLSSVHHVKLCHQQGFLKPIITKIK